MGATAQMFVEFAKPLLDATDGSYEQVEKALALSTLCYNLALLPTQELGQSLVRMKTDFKLSDDDIFYLLSSTIIPMIARYEEMFPSIHERSLNGPTINRSRSRWNSDVEATAEDQPTVDRYGPCSCNSGRKYKFCCGRSPR